MKLLPLPMSVPPTSPRTTASTTTPTAGPAASPAATWPGAPPEFGGITVPELLYVPFSSGAGGARDLVEIGRSVAAGELLAPGADPNHAAIAPVAGTVQGVESVPLFDERWITAVRLTPADPAAESAPPTPLDSDAAAERVARLHRRDLPEFADRFWRAGVWSDRRGSPALIAQLRLAMRRPVDTVICSLLDADASVCLNAALAAHYPRELVAGVTAISQLMAANHSWIVADERVPGAWLGQVRRLVRKTSSRLLAIPNDYPQADPTLLMYTLLGRRLRPGRLPVEQGALILDAAAAIAVGRAAVLDEPLLAAPLLVRDHPTRRTYFLFANIGTPLRSVLDSLSLSPHPASVLRGGDVLRDLRLPDRAVVSGSELVVHVSDPEPAVNPEPCTRCGWCIEACPTGVQPAVVLEAAQRNDLDLAERAGLEACIDCGICAYVCPSKLPLLRGTRVMKRASAEIAGGETEPASS